MRPHSTGTRAACRTRSTARRSAARGSLSPAVGSGVSRGRRTSSGGLRRRPGRSSAAPSSCTTASTVGGRHYDLCFVIATMPYVMRWSVLVNNVMALLSWLFCFYAFLGFTASHRVQSISGWRHTNFGSFRMFQEGTAGSRYFF